MFQVSIPLARKWALPVSAASTEKACPDFDGNEEGKQNHICAQSANHAPGLLMRKGSSTLGCQIHEWSTNYPKF